jgi:hypothetical protein
VTHPQLTERRLFIGGYADGQRLVTGDSPYYKVIEYAPLDLRSLGGIFPEIAQFKEHLYRLEGFTLPGGHIITFYVYAPMTPSESINLLLDGYRAPSAF